ncbi:MAG TPA: MliC family protein, partial [Psychrobacter sp.]|uniref:MliC family protein n=1 Tax=Psychrobacter sp. TaxID=56811 RepID=UPI002B5AD512
MRTRPSSHANLEVSLPKIGVANKNIRLNQAVSGSGARYTNNSDPKMSYDWHTKADYGIMRV